MQDTTKVIANHVRVLMSRLARNLDKATNGKIKPAHVTTVSLLGHIPAAWALWTGKPVLAAVLIAVFGLLDALDGALARAQGTASKLGMFYDAVTDRVKEIIIYSALAMYVSNNSIGADAWLVVAVAGTSILVSFVKAKGEMAVTAKNHDKQALNRAFDNGISRYEVRMALLITGLLLTDLLAPLLRLMVALNMFTAAIRFLEISKILNQEDQHDTKNRSAHS
jgi:CDP-diacylglycerol--glycerol-3-phosphate 3-phosphatidyltransferase